MGFEKKTLVIQIRCTERQKNRLKGLAKIYADGNVSDLVLDWVLNGASRKFVKAKRKSKGP